MGLERPAVEENDDGTTWLGFDCFACCWRRNRRPCVRPRFRSTLQVPGGSAINEVDASGPRQRRQCCDRDLEVQFLDGPHKRMIFLLQKPAGGGVYLQGTPMLKSVGVLV
ncbi:hypothetical protein PIB30_104529 [Stylosanthes scabra]|uniref:Uncharacterized protein n=1 Tax=Stylosanthes scabra TaxID=79078 RepID=A0ABU6YXV0_9FABA|nr:hypothetical protein [Stylosanthes scabra]